MLSDQMIMECLTEIANHPNGVLGVMTDEQIEMGRTIMPIGTTNPFRILRRDWDEALISTDGTRVYIVIVTARRKRRGAFHRLVNEIREAGLTPVVCAPIGPDMPLILCRWGWSEVRQDEWELDRLNGVKS